MDDIKKLSDKYMEVQTIEFFIDLFKSTNITKWYRYSGAPLGRGPAPSPTQRSSAEIFIEKLKSVAFNNKKEIMLHNIISNTIPELVYFVKCQYPLRSRLFNYMGTSIKLCYNPISISSGVKYSPPIGLFYNKSQNKIIYGVDIYKIEMLNLNKFRLCKNRQTEPTGATAFTLFDLKSYLLYKNNLVDWENKVKNKFNTDDPSILSKLSPTSGYASCQFVGDFKELAFIRDENLEISFIKNIIEANVSFSPLAVHYYDFYELLHNYCWNLVLSGSSHPIFIDDSGYNLVPEVLWSIYTTTRFYR